MNGHNLIQMGQSAEYYYEYEENEVLWAKIRGYPWWPAYVSEIHPHERPEEFQFTVVFFGDNTNSRLGPSKLRKFLQSYPTFYIKSKTNRNLKLSIEKAEERLKENEQDVEIYERIRSSFSKKKKKNGAKSESKISSSDKGEIMDIPQLTKHKTYEVYRKASKKQELKSSEKNIEEMVEEKQEQQIFDQDEANKKSNNQKQEEEEKEKEEEVAVKYEAIKNRELNKIQNKSTSPKKKQQMQDVHSESLSLQNQRSLRLRQKSTVVPDPSESSNQKEISQKSEKSANVTKQRGRVAIARRGKKGRPRKCELIIKEKQVSRENIQSQNEAKSPSPLQREQPLRRRRGHGRMSRVFTQRSLNIQNLPSSQLSPLDLEQIQRVKNCLPQRKELIKLLSTMSITTSNVKEILDLRVTDVLLNGAITKTVHTLLNLLKATLLRRYFPEDNKHRKKHEKFLKQIKKIRIESEENSEGKEKRQESEQQQQWQEQKADEGSYMNQIRKKTVVKLERMIKKSGIEENAQQLALQIESSFQETADALGQKYNPIAYERMRQIKTKLSEFCDCEAPIEQIRQYVEKFAENSKVTSH